MAKREQGRFTPIGHELFTWEPLTTRSTAARWVWLTCYASGEAKRSLPGLFPGSLLTIADVARMSTNEAGNAIDELVESRLVAFDQRNRLLRYLELPDPYDRAHTHQAISGWWTRFRSLPACPQRDAHVPLLQWMVQQGEVNDKMKDVWSKTFGSVSVPTDLPTFTRLAMSDTSTSAQPSLFGPTTHGTPHGRGLATPLPLDPDLDLDQEAEKRGGVEQNAGVVVGPWPALRLVPEGPLRSDAEIEAEARNARADEMKAVWQEAARASGADFLLPQTRPTPKDPE